MADSPARTITVPDAIHERRSVRTYCRTPVGESTIRALLDAAVQAPTALHAEPWAFVVVQNREVLQRLSDRAKAAWLKDAGEMRDLHAPGHDDHASQFAAALARPDFNIFYDAPALIVICGKPMGMFVTADCWLAAENLMLSAYAMGYGTCCIGSAVPVLNLPAVKRELNIPPDVTAVAPIIVGVSSTRPPDVPRHPPQILSWI